MREDYADNRVSYGQCYCTALVVNDFFGGSICEVFFPEGGGHYWNRIDGGDVDLTRDQFGPDQLFPLPNIIEREDMAETPEYLLLRKRVLELS